MSERFRRVMHDSALSERTAKADGMATTVHQSETTARSTKEIHERSELKRTGWHLYEIKQLPVL